jgi:uncharacterized protein GlcG (DUF336 family)
MRLTESLTIIALLLGVSVPTSVAWAQDNSTDTPPSTVPSLAATIAAMPKNLPREKGPRLAIAIAAAQAAQRTCNARHVPVSVLIADVVGAPIVLLSGDGAGVRSQLITHTKARIVARYRMPSGEVELRAKSDPSLVAQAAADPEIGVLRGGGFPVMRNGEMIGIVAVSGGSLSGAKGLDEECAQVAVRRLEMP